FFFFSSRRRHTRFSRDWSSDVCSSDLADRSSEAAREIRDMVAQIRNEIAASVAFMNQSAAMVNEQAASAGDVDASLQALVLQARSEERRVGKEWRSRWAPYQSEGTSEQ